MKLHVRLLYLSLCLVLIALPVIAGCAGTTCTPPSPPSPTPAPTPTPTPSPPPTSTIAAQLPASYSHDATTKLTTTAPAANATIPVDPVTGSAEPLTITWNPAGTGTGLAKSYLFSIYQTALGPATATYIPVTFTVGSPQVTAPRVTIWPMNMAQKAIAPDFNFDFAPGTQYSIMIQVTGEVSGDAIMGPPSAPLTFSVAPATSIVQAPYAGSISQAPPLGGTDVALRPGFVWATIPGVVKWEFELSTGPATKADGTFTTTVVSLTGNKALTTNAYQPSADLTYSTVYFWHVRGINTTGAATPWGTGCFTTMAQPVAPTPPVVVQQRTITPAWIWAVVIIGAILVIAVIALIFTTRRP